MAASSAGWSRFNFAPAAATSWIVGQSKTVKALQALLDKQLSSPPPPPSTSIDAFLGTLTTSTPFLSHAVSYSVANITTGLVLSPRRLPAVLDNSSVWPANHRGEVEDAWREYASVILITAVVLGIVLAVHVTVSWPNYMHFACLIDTPS